MQLNYEDAASPVCSPPAPTPALAGASHPRLLPAPAVVPAVPVQPAAAVLTLQDSIQELRQGKVSAGVENLARCLASQNSESLQRWQVSSSQDRGQGK